MRRRAMEVPQSKLESASADGPAAAKDANSRHRSLIPFARLPVLFAGGLVSDFVDATSTRCYLSSSLLELGKGDSE